MLQRAVYSILRGTLGHCHKNIEPRTNMCISHLYTYIGYRKVPWITCCKVSCRALDVGRYRCIVLDVAWYSVRGGENAYKLRALSCRSLSGKEPLIIVRFCRNDPEI